jgi:hypothetical protein
MIELHGASKLGTAASGPIIAAGRVLFQDLHSKVFAQDGDRHLVALDESSGRLVSAALLGGPTGQQQPVPFGGFVFTGIAAGGSGRGTGDLLKAELLRGGASGFAYGVDAFRIPT